ncbi:MAG: hypothetical protein AB7H66_14430 [Hyphomonadaceae bacterium]
MTQPRSNSRRFVNAAWSLLTFQMIASAGAVAVTGLAAFHVSEIIRPSQQASDPVVEAAVEETSEAPATTEGPAPPADGATEAAADPARQPAAEPAPGLPSPAADAPAAAEAARDPAAAAEPARPVNDGPGALRLSRDERGNITASLSDPDGVGRSRIQWLRNGNIIPGATGTTYTVTYNDSESAISARAEYVDGDGFRETVVSNAIDVGAFIR